MSKLVMFPKSAVDNIIKQINPEILEGYRKRRGDINYEYVNTGLNIKGFTDPSQLNDEERVKDFISFLEDDLQSSFEMMDILMPSMIRRENEYKETLKKYNEAKTEEERERLQGLLYIYEGR